MIKTFLSLIILLSGFFTYAQAPNSIELRSGKWLVVFSDSSKQLVWGILKKDSVGYFISYQAKGFRKDTLALEKKIIPSQTAYIKTASGFRDSLTGKSFQSCWLFAILPGNITLYSTVPGSEERDDMLTHIQKKSGPIQLADKNILGGMLKDKHSAYEIFLKGRMWKAVKEYNKSK